MEHEKSSKILKKVFWIIGKILKIKPAFLLNTDCVLIIEYDQITPIKKLKYFIIINLLV